MQKNISFKNLYTFAKEIFYHLPMLYWAFYKSTVILNLTVSLAVAFLGMIYDGNFFVLFAGSFVTIGLLAVLLYKEIACPVEYCFYYNRGISKMKLIIFCWLVNLLPATLIIFILYYVAST